MARDQSDPHESAGHRWALMTRIRSERDEEGEWYPADRTNSERGSEENEESMRDQFQRHLRQGHEAERIRK